MRRYASPTCPLCRAPAPRACKATALNVDGDRAAQVRRSVGFSAYESKRRKLWSDAAKAPEELRATPLLCTKSRPKRWQVGDRLGLRFSEPRHQEMVRRAMAPGGTRRFAAVTRTRAGGVVAGAQGRLCEITESNQGDDGVWHVIVEAGPICRVLGVTSEEIRQASPHLFIGDLEEVEESEEHAEEEEEEEEDQDADGIEEGHDDGAVVPLRDGQLEMLQERHLLLEVLHATMQLERARLEQRRLEFMMLLSQRRMLQEIAELNSQVAELADLTAFMSDPVLATGELRSRLDPEGTRNATSSSQQMRLSREIPTRQVIDPRQESHRASPSTSPTTTSRMRLSTGVFSSFGLAMERIERARSNAGGVSSGSRLAHVADGSDVAYADRNLGQSSLVRTGPVVSGTDMLRTPTRLGREGRGSPEQERPRQSSRTSGVASGGRALTQAEALRRRGNGTASSSLAGIGSSTFSTLSSLASTGSRRSPMSGGSMQSERPLRNRSATG